MDASQMTAKLDYVGIERLENYIGKKVCCLLMSFAYHFVMTFSSPSTHSRAMVSPAVDILSVKRPGTYISKHVLRIDIPTVARGCSSSILCKSAICLPRTGLCGHRAPGDVHRQDGADILATPLVRGLAISSHALDCVGIERLES